MSTTVAAFERSAETDTTVVQTRLLTKINRMLQQGRTEANDVIFRQELDLVFFLAIAILGASDK